MSKKTLALIAALTIVCALLVYAALVGQKKSTPPPSPTPTPTPSAAKTVLMLSQATASPTTVDVLIDANGNNVTAVQLELRYNPQAVAITAVRPGNFFTSSITFITTIDNKTGRVTYALGIPPNGNAAVGKGTVAHVMYARVGTPGQTTTLSLLPRSLVTALGEKESVLKSASPTTITLQ